MMTIEYLRSFRIGNYAIFDLVASFVGVYLLSPLLIKLFLKFKIKTTLKNWLFLTLPLGIIIHLLVGQKTIMVTDFLDTSNYFLIKIIILVSTYFGVKGIKKIN